MSDFTTAKVRWLVTINPAKHIIVPLSDDLRAEAVRIARARHENKSAKYSRNYQRIDANDPLREDVNGVTMECGFAFAVKAPNGRPLLKVDTEVRPGGDNGIDFKLRDGRTINVMCADIPENLIVWVSNQRSERPLTEKDEPLGSGCYRNKVGYIDADIQVLGSVDEGRRHLGIWGWAFFEDVKTYPIRVNKPKLPFNRRNYNLPRGLLYPVSDLIALVRQVQGRCQCERATGGGCDCGNCDWEEYNSGSECGWE